MDRRKESIQKVEVGKLQVREASWKPKDKGRKDVSMYDREKEEKHSESRWKQASSERCQGDRKKKES